MEAGVVDGVAIDRPFNDVQGLLDYIPRNIEEIHNRKFGDMFTFAGRSNVWGAFSNSPREQFLELQERWARTP